ncbi:MAG: S8/S53 family peptidase [Acidobacteriota bacterium]
MISFTTILRSLSDSCRRRPVTSTDSPAALGALPGLAVALLLLLAAAPASAAVTWQYTDGACGVPTGANVMRCGGYGFFDFGGGPAAGAPVGRGPSCGGVVYGQTENHRRLPASPVPPASPTVWYPCDGGSCFSPPSTEPWAAIIDWDNGHGWTVGATMLQTSGGGLRARLYPLDAPTQPVLQALDGVGDAHVLHQLCELAEEMAYDGSNPPQVVNMSFGRLLPDSSRMCDTQSLACEIRGVVDHLHDRYGIRFVAAAGNQGQLLFPAVLDSVMAVGSVDITYYHETSGIRGSATAPSGSQALFPAHGLVLEEGGNVWPAPAGASYASAFAAGWIAEYLSRHPEMKEVVFDSSIAPLSFVDLADIGSFHLARAGIGIPGSELPTADPRLQTAAGDRPEVWDQVLRSRTEWRTGILGAATGVATTTFDEISASTNSPTPHSHPCVPCHDMPDGPGGGLIIVRRDGAQRVGGGFDLEARVDWTLAVDLSWSRGLSSALVLEGLFVKIGESLYAFDDSRSPTFLSSFATGGVERLVIENLPVRTTGHEVMLVYELSLREQPQVGRFVSATPIILHGD